MLKDELLTSILSDTTTGELFKTNFMILVITSMIENYEDGHIYKNLMDCLDEIDNVSQYDWCEYVLRSLVNHTIKWKSNKTMSFTGPILFLLNQREELAEERRQQDKGNGLAVEIPETERCNSNNLAIKRHREEADIDMPTKPAETPRVSKKKKAVIQTSIVSTRSRATLKQPQHFTNLVDTRETLTASECELHYWAMENKSDDEREIVLYSDEREELRRDEMLSLNKNTYISSAVIDVCSSILNHDQAMLPEQQTSRRFFLTTNVSNYMVVAPSKEWNDQKVSKLFVDNILYELNAYPNVKVHKTNMFFFPTLQSEHFYIIVIDTRRMVAEIIDNSNAMVGEQDDPLLKYEHFPARLMTGLLKLTKEVTENIKSMNHLKMLWRISTNSTDCGVFVMRHMETYMGGVVKNWKSGLRAKNQMQLRYLRIKYCAAILTAEYNIHMQRNIRDARLYFQASSKDNPISIENLYLEDDNE
ncbi:hypothetical protein C2S51_015616 [Perilla frutescens var. frutescens]|nr:hypothetical protein C2S51_015616 [Perilla frutescens var. frutescens]